MYSPSHRPTMSASNLGSPPGIKQERRMTSPAPPPAPLDLPQPMSNYASYQPNPSRSPLRNGVTLDPATGTFSEDGSPTNEEFEPWGTRDGQEMNHSPSPSITKFASSFAQRVGSLVSSVSPGSQPGHLPTEAELEAESESQRERSRREAERILTQEAVERKKVEERVLEMLEASRTRPNRSQTAPPPGTSPSPTPSNKEGGGGWWSAAKNKLTPTKELTPAQQLVLDTKAREKDKRKSKDKDWPSTDNGKYEDPAYQQLNLPPGARPPGGAVGGGANVVPASPGSPSPRSNQAPRQLTGSPAARTPSPSRGPTQPLNPRHNNNSTTQHTKEAHPLPRPPTASPVPSASSSRDPPPLYAQFSSQGALDVPGTLLTIARRFEKLERWTVGHVRALEERMSDVEKWLVDKEHEREREAATSNFSTLTARPGTVAKEGERDVQPVQQVVREVTIERKTVEIDQEVKREVGEMKEELGELRGRVGELGQEMARLASTADDSPSHSVSPSEASGFGIGRIASPGDTGTGPHTPAALSPRTLPSVPAQQGHTQSPSAHSIAQSETASIVSSGTAARTKLPYPTGDYTSPSPPSSPRPSASQNVGNYTANNASSNISRTRPLSYSGLPIPQTNFTSSVGLPHSSGANAPSSGSPSLPTPPGTGHITSSSTPRKRYTVALGQPLSSSPSTSSPAALVNASYDPPTLGLDEKRSDFGQPLFAEPQTAELQTAYFSHVPGESETDEERDEDDAEEGKAQPGLKRQETIGKTPITLSRLSLSPPPLQNASPTNRTTLQRSSPRPSPSNPRIRAQSTYGVPGSSTSSISLPRHDSSPSDGKGSWRTRSRSIDRVGLGIDAGHGVGNFVDPLVVRKKEKAKDTVGSRSPAIVSPGVPRGRVAFGDLVAFFDAEKQ